MTLILGMIIRGPSLTGWLAPRTNNNRVLTVGTTRTNKASDFRRYDTVILQKQKYYDNDYRHYDWPEPPPLLSAACCLLNLGQDVRLNTLLHLGLAQLTVRFATIHHLGLLPGKTRLLLLQGSNVIILIVLLVISSATPDDSAAQPQS